MEKMVVKGRKEIRLLLNDSLHQTIQALGIADPGKKVSKMVARSAKGLSSQVAKQMRKELKKMSKLRKKAERRKQKSEPIDV